MSESLLPSSAERARQMAAEPGREVEVLRGRLGRARDAGDPRLLWEASQEFESILLHQLIQAMRKTVPKSKFFHGGLAEDTYQGLLDQELARGASRAQGLGLAPIIYRQLGGPAAPAAGGMEPPRHLPGGVGPAREEKR